MGDSRMSAPFPILSWILMQFIKKNVSVNSFNRDHYSDTTYDGVIYIEFDTVLEVEARELLYKLLHIIRQTLAQGRFVDRYVFGHANLERGHGNYIDYDDENAVNEENSELPFEWTYHPPSEEDDYAELPCYQLKYSIAMDEKILPPEYGCEIIQWPHLTEAHLEQLRKDVEILCGKDEELAEDICKTLHLYRPYEIGMLHSGQDIFISAGIVRKFKEDIDLEALESRMVELLKEGDPLTYLKKKLAGESILRNLDLDE